jgi:hypothetical protein
MNGTKRAREPMDANGVIKDAFEHVRDLMSNIEKELANVEKELIAKRVRRRSDYGDEKPPPVKDQ